MEVLEHTVMGPGKTQKLIFFFFFFFFFQQQKGWEKGREGKGRREGGGGVEGCKGTEKVERRAERV